MKKSPVIRNWFSKHSCPSARLELSGCPNADVAAHCRTALAGTLLCVLSRVPAGCATRKHCRNGGKDERSSQNLFDHFLTLDLASKFCLIKVAVMRQDRFQI